MKHIAIIGNGISGITAARNIRKSSNHKITIISAETEYFFSRTALMYIYMGHLKFEHTKPYEDHFWKKNKLELKKGLVKDIDFTKNRLYFDGGNVLDYDELILATGSKPNKFGWPGQDLTGVQGFYSYQDLEKVEAYSKNIRHAVIVGGGLIGVEMAEMFISRNISVTLLVREKSFWNIVLPEQESALINKHIRSHHVDLRLETELKEITDDGNGRVKSITTTTGEEILCNFVGLTVGVHPNISFLKSTPIEMNKGILVNEYLETNLPNVYAIGDCAEHRLPPKGRKAIEQVWYTGKIMGEVVAQTICNNKTSYRPGIWFNSAKFFDIEYQTYGFVNATRSEDEDEIYWEHQGGMKCVHIIFSKTQHTIMGINTFGIRMRHEVFDKWLRETKTIEFVLRNLKEANFDPEFFTRHEEEIINVFNAKFPDNGIVATMKKIN
ncbi:MAG: NAD(P)/FAD-dependent oxidoreductase [Cyclobacteriaceae bacterium]|nr:NAD(P)/FAD-dependent oxidoreductase [Cyclobacteriaceae bacterium]